MKPNFNNIPLDLPKSAYSSAKDWEKEKGIDASKDAEIPFQPHKYRMERTLSRSVQTTKSRSTLKDSIVRPS